MKNLVFIVSFLLYGGYYSLLALLISFGLSESSRNFTVPIRLLTSTLMAYVIFKRLTKYRIGNYKKWIYFLFFSFWILYFLKVVQNYSLNIPLMRTWYEYILYSINFCILPFMMYSLIDLEKYKNIIIRALIFSGFVLGVISIYLYNEVFTMGIGRVNMLFYSTGRETLSPLALSYIGTLTILLILYEFLYNKTRTRLYNYYLFIAIFLAFIMFFLGASRGAVVSIATGLIILFLYSNFKTKKRVFYILILSLPIVIWGALKSGTSIIERTRNTFSGQVRINRFDLWEAAYEMFLDNPILGGTIELVNAPGYKYTNNPNIYPHNFLLETLMATGLIGLIILLSIIVTAVNKVAVLTIRNNSRVWVLLILFQGLSQYFFSGAIYGATLLFFPLGMIYSFNSRLKIKK